MPETAPNQPLLAPAPPQASSKPSIETPPGIEEKPPEKPYPWILSPTIDLLFCCGGIFWLVFAVYKISGVEPNLFGNPTAFSLMLISIMALNIFGDAHQPATLMRVYGSAQTRKSLGKITTILGVIALGAGLCTFLIPETSIFWVKVVLAWGFQHQLSQSYGICLLYCIKRGYRMNKYEKLIMAGMINCTTIYLILRMFSIEAFGQGNLFGGAMTLPFWSIVPPSVTAVSLAVLQISVVLFFAMLARKYYIEKKFMPLPGLLTLMTLVVLPVCAGEAFFLVWMLFSQHLFHSSQYLVVTTAYYLKERGLPENVSFWQISRFLKSWTFAKYFGIVVGTGFFISYIFPNFLIDNGAEKALAFSAVYVFINLHHFAVDGLIWKLRDPVLQKLLIA